MASLRVSMCSAVAVATLVSVAQAAPRAAVLVPQMRPTPSPELSQKFHEAITRGLSIPDLEVVPAAEVRLRLGISEELMSCGQSGPCAARAATALRADRLVAGEVAVFGKDYAVRLVLLDAAGREVGRTEEACDICTVKEAEDAAARAAGRLAMTARTAPAAPPPAKAEPAPPPPKAEPTPPAAKAEPVPPGGPVTKEKKPFPWRWVAVGSLALGVVGLAAGIPLLVIDGRPTCDLPDPGRSCPEVYDTAGAGAALVTLGAAGLVASGVLFYLDYRSRHRPPARVFMTPVEGGAMVTASGHF